MVTRVIQWSSGNVGKGVIQAVAERPDLTLAGLLVFSDTKAGKDAGEIAGTAPLGVTATTSIDEIAAVDADVVIHTPLPSLVYGDDPGADVDHFCLLLSSGKNVITTVGYMYPKVHGPELVARLEAACKEGGTTFHSTGANPGWLGDILPLTMSGMSKRIDQVYTREIGNFQYYPSPEIMFGMMGFSKTDEEFEKDASRFTHWLNGLFRENVLMVADGLGAPLDEISHEMVRAHATTDLETASGQVRKGTIAGQKWKWAGISNGRELVVHETVWRMHESVSPNWPTGDHTIAIKGEPNMKLEFGWSFMEDQALLGTGMHAVNAIPYVCEAEPGIKSLIDLPTIMGRGAVL